MKNALGQFDLSGVCKGPGPADEEGRVRWGFSGVSFDPHNLHRQTIYVYDRSYRVVGIDAPDGDAAGHSFGLYLEEA